MKCKICNKRSYSDYCYLHKPYKPIKKQAKIKRVSAKTKKQNDILRIMWYRKNRPDQYGRWECYLQISSQCPVSLTRQTLTLEHVESKVRSPEKKFLVSNIKPSCSWCNRLKGSKSLEELARVYPRLQKYIKIVE